MDLTFATLMARAGDEPDAMYGLAAKSVQISADKLVYRFTLRPKRNFTTAQKLTAHDAAFSLTTLKAKGHPLVLQQMRDMVTAEASDDATLVVTFAEKRARDVPALCLRACRFFREFITPRVRSMNPRSTFRSALGLTRSENSKPIAYIEFERVKDWWGAIFPFRAAVSISTSCRYNSIATATWRSKALPRRIYLFREEFTARCGPRVTIFLRSRTAG